MSRPRKAEVDEHLVSILSSCGTWVDSPSSPTESQIEALRILTDAGFIEWWHAGNFTSPTHGATQIALSASGPNVESGIAASAPGFVADAKQFRRTAKGDSAAMLAERNSAAVVQGIRKSGSVDSVVQLDLAGCELFATLDRETPTGDPPSHENWWGSEPGDTDLDTALRLWIGVREDKWETLTDETPARIERAVARLVSCGFAEWKFSGTVTNEDTGDSTRLAFVVSGYKPQQNGISVAFITAGYPVSTRRKFSQDHESKFKLSECGSEMRRLWASDELFDCVAGIHVETWDESFRFQEVTPSPSGKHLPPVTASDPLGIEQPGAPQWDAEKSILTFAGHQRGYARRALNPVLVLTAFEEDGWPFRIDTPLKPDANLREVVRSLNKGLLGMRFERDGSGTGICWHPTRTHTEPTR